MCPQLQLGAKIELKGTTTLLLRWRDAWRTVLGGNAREPHGYLADADVRVMLDKLVDELHALGGGTRR